MRRSGCPAGLRWAPCAGVRRAGLRWAPCAAVRLAGLRWTPGVAGSPAALGAGGIGRVALLAALLWSGGCAPDLGAEARAPGAVDLQRPLQTPLDADAVQRLEGPVDTQLPDQALQVVELVREQGVRLLDQPPPRGYLDEIEISFFATGRSLELADLYLEAVERAGEGAWMRPRLAWMYERLGLHTAAEREAQQALAELPQSAEAHFVMGFILGQDEAAGDEKLSEVLTHFREALALDPRLLAPGGVTSSDLRREIEALEARLASGDAHDH